MHPELYKINLLSDKESDFALLMEICTQIMDLSISLNLITIEQINSIENLPSELNVVIVASKYFGDTDSRSILSKAFNSNIPVICLMDRPDEGNTQAALAFECNDWLYKNVMNAPIVQHILLKAEHLCHVSNQAQYLRKKFHESEKRFISVFRSKSEAIIVLGAEGMIRYVNPVCEETFGVKRQFMGFHFPYELRPGQVREINLAPLTGWENFVQITVGELIWEDELCLTVTLQDISRQRRIENELLLFQHVIRMSPLPIVITDNQFRVIFLNESFQRSSGYKLDELLGKKTTVLRSSWHEPAFYKSIKSVLLAGGNWQGEICNKMKNGQLRWEKYLISPVKNRQGKVDFYISIRTEDIEKNEADKLKSKAETLKSVQELAGGVAHEFSQPLQVLSISMSLMENEFGKSEYFEKADKNIKRIIDLVNNLKSITAIRQQDYLSTKILDIRASSKNAVEQSKKTRILIIDDQPEILDSLLDVLRLSGYSSDGATNGPDALEYLSKNSYSLIISDVDMPNMSGTDVFRKIKEMDYGGAFVFMTGYEIDDIMEDTISKADAFLAKPFQLSQLTELVDTLLKST